MDPTTLTDAQLIAALQAIAEETRLALVRELAHGERCVCELQSELSAAQSRLSFHLRKLKEAGIVADRRDGRWVYYRLVPGVFEQLGEALGQLVPADPWRSEFQSDGPRCR